MTPAEIRRPVNPRYAAYCAAHGRTPEDMLAHDEQEWPGGKMCGYVGAELREKLEKPIIFQSSSTGSGLNILWISRQWRAWASESGRRCSESFGDKDHASFDARLNRLHMQPQRSLLDSIEAQR